MGVIYVDSGAVGLNNGTSWTDAYTTLQAALTAWTTGDVIYMESAHSETVSAGLTGGGSDSERAQVLRVSSIDDSYSGKPTTANISTTGTNDINLDCNAAFYGVYFDSDDLVLLNSNASLMFVDCVLRTDDRMAVGSSSTWVALELINTDLMFDGAGGYIQMDGGFLYVKGGSHTKASSTNAFVVPQGSRYTEFKAIGCDMSAVAASENLVNFPGAGAVSLEFTRCDMPTTFDTNQGDTGSSVQSIYLYSSDDGGDDWYTEKTGFRGTVSTDTGTYLDSGFSFEGSQSLSVLMAPVSASVCNQGSPIEGIPIYFRYDGATGSSKTFTVELCENYTTALTDYQVWMDLYYCGTSGQNNWSIASSRNLDSITSGTSGTSLSAGTGLANWTGEPASSRSVKISVSATPQVTGIYMAIVYLAQFETAKEFFYNPEVTVS